ncbi:MAG: S-layer homology domain-containing protein [Acidimicrobiia bacterium]
MPAPNRKRLIAFVVALAVLIATPLTVVAAAGFTDVSDSNVFTADIQWLSDAGVTKGCNPPANTEFCPSDNVTREQMAAFMHRFAEYMGAADGTPAQADNASTVNGVSVEHFFHQAAPNTTDEVIGTYGPVTLKASCDGSGVPTLRASWDETVNRMTFNGSGAALTGDATVNANQTISIGSGTNGTVGTTDAVGYDSHTQTQIQFFLRDAPALGDNMCFFSGYVTVGG